MCSISEAKHSISVSNNPTKVEELKFKVTHMVKEKIKKAFGDFSKHSEIHSFSTLEFQQFGKNKIKEWKFSPDGFVQMAFQLAYFSMKEKLVATYESSQTRSFKYGRTEVIRSASEAVLEWIESMHSSNIDTMKKYELLRTAVSKHSSYAKDATRGLGIDRHLTGLSKVIAPSESQPAFFQDPSYSISKNWLLSTSQISSKYYEGWGWGEVVQNGFGIPYSILDDHIFVGISSRHGETEAFKEHIQTSLLKMKQLVQEATLFRTGVSKL